MRMRTLGAAVLAVLLPAWALAWPEAPPPPESERVTVEVAGGSVTLWPYATNDYSQPYDPINLFFPGQDPREIRQALLELNGAREGLLPDDLPVLNCLWADAMGSEQVAWAEPAGWVGGVVQLVCTHPESPLGYPFRVHLRLYRQGPVTLGAAHFEFLIPDTAEHEVLSWDLAREFVALDMWRTGYLIAPPEEDLEVQPAGPFRAVRRPVYDALVDAGAGDLLASLQLFPTSPTGDVPILTSGTGIGLAAGITLDPAWKAIRSAVKVDYNVVVPKPFCAEGEADLVHLGGPVHLSLAVYTSPYGTYDRRHYIRGTLMVTPVVRVGDEYVPTGPSVPALINQNQRGVLTDWYGQLSERGSQILLSDPRQSAWWMLLGGYVDGYFGKVTCGPEDCEE
jgi:hypothetical protein